MSLVNGGVIARDCDGNRWGWLCDNRCAVCGWVGKNVEDQKGKKRKRKEETKEKR